MQYLKVSQNNRRGALKFKVDDRDVTIGRDESNRLRLLDARVSRRHCVIRTIEGIVRIFDLESSHGVFVNDIRVDESNLFDGDVIEIGPYTLRFRDDGEGEETFVDRLALRDPWHEESESADEEPTSDERRSAVVSEGSESTGV
jgi:pSer/pThr/pTyr-binding forkhead associated (FHA) protein